MPRIFPLAALLVAALASTPASASISVAPQKPSVTADAMHQAYATRWDEAIQQSRSGNTLGALIAMERLMEDPMCRRSRTRPAATCSAHRKHCRTTRRSC